MGKVTIDDLAIMVQKGFSIIDEKFDHLEGKVGHLETRFDHLENKVEHLETRFDHLDERVDNIEFKIDMLAPQSDVDSLEKRVCVLEKKPA